MQVNAERYEQSLIVLPDRIEPNWAPAGFAGLVPSDFEHLLAFEPEIVVFGSGTRLRFPPPAFLRALMEKRIGIETMDTLAACRTYNILAGEGRRVIAALLIETESTSSETSD